MAFALGSETSSARAHRAYSLRKLGKYEDAFENYDRALTLDPENLNIWDAKGVTYSHLKEYERALECFDKLLAIRPDDLSALNNKGTVLYDLERYEEALEYFNRAFEINPNFQEAKKNRQITARILNEKKTS